MNRFYIDGLIKNALLEDVNNRDISSECLFAADHTSRARFAAKQEGVLCGIEVALRVFELLDESFRAEVFLKDGAALSKGDVIAEVSGRTLALLQGERTALNLLQHMSGIATLTDAYVRRTEGTKAKICDTRKTLPGLRPLQKYAVACGGGKNHRFNLSDAVMLKDNHIDAAGSIAKAVAAARKNGWGIALRDPTPDDDVPTKLEPPRLFRPILALFKAIGIMPGYNEADVSVPFFLFFSIFFAMIVGDAGYGTILLLLTLH
ncbi:MAG TPA: carboxylating nicotinate-nucleotide diphosphorylase, partial [Clostridiales bacterium]|nr:carboxylating nicotinate-nucleotide diphosphorylase [Clostridiales bacterium]